MRGKRFIPYAAGLLTGVGALLAVCVLAALVLSLTDSAGSAAGAASVLALAIGSFVSGRTAGMIKRRDGLKTGALCGIMFSAAAMLISLIFGEFGTIMLLLKPLLCAFFGAAGGVAGVNK